MLGTSPIASINEQKNEYVLCIRACIDQVSKPPDVAHHLPPWPASEEGLLVKHKTDNPPGCSDFAASVGLFLE